MFITEKASQVRSVGILICHCTRNKLVTKPKFTLSSRHMSKPKGNLAYRYPKSYVFRWKITYTQNPGRHWLVKLNKKHEQLVQLRVLHSDARSQPVGHFQAWSGIWTPPVFWAGLGPYGLTDWPCYICIKLIRKKRRYLTLAQEGVINLGLGTPALAEEVSSENH